MRLLERSIETLHAYYELGNERTRVGRAVLVANSNCPDVYDANCVTRITAETGADIDRLLDEVDAAYSAVTHRCFKVEPLTPAPFAARLALEGYQPNVELQSVLETGLGITATAVDIRPGPTTRTGFRWPNSSAWTIWNRPKSGRSSAGRSVSPSRWSSRRS